MKIKKKNLECIIYTLMIFFVSFLNISSVHIPFYEKIRLIFAILLSIFMLVNIKIFIKREYCKINILLIIITCGTIYSTILNKNSDTSSLYNTIMYLFKGILIFFVLEYISFIRKTKLCMKILYVATMSFSILSDVLMFIIPSKFSVTDISGIGNEFNSYLLGNKFNVVYFHIFATVFFICLCEQKLLKKKLLLFLHMLILFLVSLYTQCSTGVVATICLLGLYISKDFLIIRLKNCVSAIISIVFFDCMLLVNATILQIPTIANFIENVLKESSDLTGRLQIYKLTENALKDSMWWGYGIDNNYAISQKFVHAANLQNGILDYMISFGIIGMILFLALIIITLKKGKESKNSLWMLLYIFIIISSVEVTFRSNFMCILALIAFSSDRIEINKRCINEKSYNNYSNL